MKLRNIRIDWINSENHALKILGCSAIIAIILIIRCYNAVFFPILHCEDGTEIVAYYSNNPHPSEILRFYAGYIPLIPNMVGFLATHLFPLHITPYIMVVFSLVLSIASLSIFSLRRYRFIMPNDKSRIFVCLIVTLIPLGNYPLITALAYSLWHIFFISLLLIIAPLPNSTLAKAAQLSFLSLAIFSHPLSIIFIPICLVLLFARPSVSDRTINGGIIILAVLYVLFGVELSDIGRQVNFSTLTITFKYIIHRVVFEPIFSNNLRVIFHQTDQDLTINILALCIVSIIYSGSKNSNLKNKFFLFSFLFFALSLITFISVVGRSMTSESHISTPWEVRYFYTQQLLFIFAAVILAVSSINWKILAADAKTAMLIFLFSYVSYLNIQNAPYFRTSKEQGIATIHFLKSVEMRLRNSENREKYPQQAVLDRGGVWDIKINLSNEAE